MQRSKRVLIGVAVAALTLAAACGGSDSNSASSGGGGTTESIRGQTITVLVPYAMSQKLLDQFTAETGVKVNYVRTGWDATHNKLLVANQAQSYIADVAEFDWSFTGQFAGAQWVEPLDGLVSASTLNDLKSTDAAFISGGKTYAACYSNDFRVSMYNTKMFAEGGDHRVPADLRRARPGRREAQGSQASSTRSRSRWRRPRAASRPGTCSRSRWAASSSTIS